MRFRMHAMRHGDPHADGQPDAGPKSLAARVPPAYPLWAGLVSVVPGLGHFVTRRKRQALRWAAAWCGCLFVGLVLYGTPLGGLLLGGTVALHARIIIKAGALEQRMGHPFLRILLSLFLFLLLAFCLYMPVRSAAGHYVRGVRSAVTIDDRVCQGDWLLVWRRAYRQAVPARGDVVLYKIAPQRGAGYSIRGGEVLSEVIAVAGDSVSVDGARITVTPAVGPAVRYDSPGIPLRGSWDLEVPDGRCFCLPPQYARTDHGGTAPSLEHYLRTVAMPDLSTVNGRAFMVWRPFWRWGLLGRAPAEEAG